VELGAWIFLRPHSFCLDGKPLSILFFNPKSKTCAELVERIQNLIRLTSSPHLRYLRDER
jgi:hypothetical protein